MFIIKLQRGPNQVYKAVGTTEVQVSRSPFSFINDLVLADNVVYATDSVNPVLYVFPLSGTRTVRTLPLPPVFAATGPGQFRGNGIALTQDKSGLLIANGFDRAIYYHKLGSKVVSRLTESDASVPLRPDGILVVGDVLYIASNGANRLLGAKVDIAKLRLNFICQITSPPYANPSTIATQGGLLWAVNAHFFSCNPASACPNQPFELIGVRATDFCVA